VRCPIPQKFSVENFVAGTALIFVAIPTSVSHPRGGIGKVTSARISTQRVVRRRAFRLEPTLSLVDLL
jgi:hypothetical protein